MTSALHSSLLLARRSTILPAFLVAASAVLATGAGIRPARAAGPDGPAKTPTTVAPAPAPAVGDTDLRTRVVDALRRAGDYYAKHVARHGGYPATVSIDLKQAWGEGAAGPDTILVQPPGTPTVGMAFLLAWQATGEARFLDAARAAGEALAYGQLRSGGWTQDIHFAPVPGARMGAYRNGKGGTWNLSSLDDGQTQSALEFLFRLDSATGFRNKTVHDAAEYGLARLIKAQFPNGGFPQVFSGPAPDRPVVKARMPDVPADREVRVKAYWEHYTLNDGLAGSVAGTLLAARTVYRDDKSLAALRKLGDFLLLAQMPDPQPAWCQQYDARMVPAWARKFEPPAIAGLESQDVMRTLLRIAAVTGDAKYLAPVLPASTHLREKCLLPDGRLARFYELGSNKPLYMDRQYRLTHDDGDTPEHYGWKHAAKLDEIEAEHKRVTALLAAGRKEDPGSPDAKPAPVRRPDEAAVRRIVDALDAEGRWVSVFAGERLLGRPKFAPGFRYLSSAVFAENMGALSAWLAGEKGAAGKP